MSEVSDDAMFLISISFQALQRIEYSDRVVQLNDSTIPCDELVTVVFLGFYIEASLDYIIKEMGQKEEMLKILSNKSGLGDKLFWFYSKNVTGLEFKDKLEFRKIFDIRKLDNEFHDFKKIYEFRNYISHGNLDKAIRCIKTEYKDTNDVDLLRTRAKEITDNLVKIAHDAGFNDIGKNIPYDDALNNYMLK